MDLRMDLRQRKLRALATGLRTDCSFLVGPDTQKPVIFHAYSSDLILASDTFEAMLRSPLVGSTPIRIKNIEPHIFKLIMEFIHVHTLSEDVEVEELVALANLADEYLIDPLKSCCAKMIGCLVTWRDVWPVLNEVVHLPEVAEKCARILSLETKKCLAHSTFREASLESLTFFLQIDSLTVGSEMDLVDACIDLGNFHGDKTVMRNLLPHLRLLTLDVRQLHRVAGYLTKEEYGALFDAVINRHKKFEPTGCLCPNPKPRSGAFQLMDQSHLLQGVIEVIPKALLRIDFHKKIKNGIYTVTKGEERNKIKFIACRKTKINGIELLAQTNGANGESDEWKTQVYQENVHLTIKKKCGYKSEVVLDEHICHGVRYRVPFLHELAKPIYVDRGNQVTITVEFQKGATYANYFTGSLGADLPKNRAIRCRKREAIVAKRYRVRHETKWFHLMGIPQWKSVGPKKSISVVRSIQCMFM